MEAQEYVTNLSNIQTILEKLMKTAEKDRLHVTVDESQQVTDKCIVIERLCIALRETFTPTTM